MSEKMYTRLLRLYPSRFRKEYEGEALQLIRDRLRDERGFFKRARLLWDLVADVLAGLPQAYRNSYAATEAASLSLKIEGIPSFRIPQSVLLDFCWAGRWLICPSRVRMDGCLRLKRW
jgi:hypothetical protein